MARRTPPKPLTLLTEAVQRGPEALRVDRAQGIVYGVKLLGRYSPNNHGLKDAIHGTEYTRAAMEAALPLYAQAKINVDHPPREKPGKDRSSLDRLGKPQNVRIQWDSTDPAGDGIYCDLLLIPSHPMSARLMDAAENPALADCFGMSHNAYGRGEVLGGRYVITEIPEVRSVDVVADAGTNRSLFESRETPVKKTLKAILEAAPAAVRTRLQPLLEDDYMGSMEAESPATALGGEGSIEDHLCALVSAILKDASLSTEQKREKIDKVLDLLEEDEDGADEEGSAMEGDEDKKKTEESRKTKQRKDAVALQERCAKLCKLAGVTAERALLEGLVAMRHESAILSHLEYIKALAVKSGTKPRSQPPGTTPVQESKGNVPQDPAKALAWLRN